MKCLVAFALAGCGNHLLPPGTCASPPAAAAPAVVEVTLFGGAAHFDDLRFSPQLGKLLAVPEDTGQLYIVDPDTRSVGVVDVPMGSGTADANATTIFVGDREGDRVIVIDAATKTITSTMQLLDNPDYVRVAPSGDELWVTTPGSDRIDVFAIAGAPAALVRDGSIQLPGAAEGLTFGERGLAYTQALGRLLVVDVGRRVTLGEHDTGCGWAHGFPQVDDARGLVVGGCADNGGVAVMTIDGAPLSGYEVGSGNAILASDPLKHHLYLRGDPGDHLDIVALCGDGGLGVLASVPIDDEGHGASADNRGHVWVADANHGSVLQISDPFPSTP